MTVTFQQKREEWLKTAPISDVELSQVKIHEEQQARINGTDPQLVSDYSESMLTGTTFAPVTLYKVENGYEILDGFHRVSAAHKADQKTVKSQVLTDLSETDKQAFKLTCNLAHGKAASTQDRSSACKALLNEHFNDFVSDYKFDSNEFAKYFGFGKSAVSEHSQWRRWQLESNRDVKILQLKHLGGKAHGIGNEIGTTRQTVGKIIKDAKGLESHLATFKETLRKIKHCCEVIIDHEHNLVEQLNLPSHNGPARKTGIGSSLAIGLDWNWDSEEQSIPLSKQAASDLFKLTNVDDFPNHDDIDWEAHNSKRRQQYLNAMTRLPEFTKVDELHGDACEFHYRRLAWDNHKGFKPKYQKAHVSAYFNDSEYKELYDFWVERTFISRTDQDTLERHLSDKSYISKIIKLWSLTDTASLEDSQSHDSVIN